MRSKPALLRHGNPGGPPVAAAIEAALAPVLGGVPLGFGSVPVLALGNDTLQVERVDSFEGGYTGVFDDKVMVSVNAYYNRIDQLITPLIAQVGTELGRINPSFQPTCRPPALRLAGGRGWHAQICRSSGAVRSPLERPRRRAHLRGRLVHEPRGFETQRRRDWRPVFRDQPDHRGCRLRRAELHAERRPGRSVGDGQRTAARRDARCDLHRQQGLSIGALSVVRRLPLERRCVSR
jgi:hypothetical protein